MSRLLKILTLAGGALAIASPAFAQEQVAELIRRVQEGAVENGWCRANVDWPNGTRDTYVQWLEGARVGHAKANSFNNGRNCQFDFVTSVYQGRRGRCVRYTWFSCNQGSRCTTGQDTDCKEGGRWVRQ